MIKENENDFVIENQGVGGIKVSFKGEKDVDIEKCIEDEVEDEIVDDDGPKEHEVEEAEETPKKKKIKRGSLTKRYYKNKFNSVWLEDPALRDWLVPIEDDITRCACLYCGRNMRSHRTDICDHARTNKHKRNRDKFILQNGVAEVSLRYIRDENHTTPKKCRAARMNSETGINIENGFEDLCDSDLVIQFDDLQADKREDISKYQKDRQISVLANRVIMSLLDDVESFMKSKTNVIFNSLVENETILDHRMFKRVRGMCIGHLANKYISEAALEISIADVMQKKERELNGSNTITDKLNSLEKQLQNTVTEMNSLKHSYTKDAPDVE